MLLCMIPSMAFAEGTDPSVIWSAPSKSIKTNQLGYVALKVENADKTKISFSGSYGIQQVSSFLDMVDSHTWASLYNNAQLGDGTSPDQLRFSEKAIRHFKDGDQPLLYPSVDWLDYVMKDSAPQQQYNVSVSGGNKTARYFVSVGMLSQDGLFRSFSQD